MEAETIRIYSKTIAIMSLALGFYVFAIIV